MGILTLVTGCSSGDGSAAEATESGSGDVVRMWIGPELTECEGVAPMECMQVSYTEDGEPQLFYSSIDGFDYQEGTSYVIDVQVSEVASPPADGSGLDYSLVAVISATPTTPAPTACHDTLVEQTEGPYYTPGAPERTDLTDDATVGIPLTLTGRVLDASCAPVAGVPIEFWQADGAGVYDNAGYELRGAQVTDADGAYVLETVIPGLYPSRTEHIHVKVTGPDGVVHTTQLYFPDVPQNDDDGIYSETMLVTVTDQTDDSMAATFDFVLPKERS